jgi:hypothetical protein
MIVSTGLPADTAAKTKRVLSGAQSPADVMNCRLLKCGSPAVFTSRRVTLPLATSATYMSIEKRSFSERKTSRRPSGLIAGLTFSSPPEVSFDIRMRPKFSAVRVVSTNGA